MKKLLLLAVLALGVIACDKNELGMDMDGSSINAIETKTDMVIPGLLGRLISDLESGNINIVKSNNASTAKTDDHIYLRFFNDGTNDYVLFTTDGITTDFCIDSNLSSVVVDRYYDNVNGDGSQLAVEVASNGAVPVTIDGDFENLFKYDFATAYKLDSRYLIIGTGTVADAVITF